MSKVSYLGSTSLKDLPTGLLAFLAQVELEESKKGKGGQCPGLHTPGALFSCQLANH